ncbi:hypothetical protein SmJEL517_g05625 [Synchytrium microbalum]|uniref:Uncharacterized protein n=1 Tax=Synchytrium microbalum TaxID=1806994 RepID=A0A507C020_9FUNG|nr:uncharacterized protein SmJEL517_g05625 [Synchytrium microbalum]TPX30945.1 hypothetical protein SmJEL517_g05625 [Synchytrium microbalum]
MGHDTTEDEDKSRSRRVRTSRSPDQKRKRRHSSPSSDEDGSIRPDRKESTSSSKKIKKKHSRHTTEDSDDSTTTKKKTKKHSRHSDSDDSPSKKKKKASKHKKKHKRDKHSSASTKAWGARGVITIHDRNSKDPEFRTWLYDIKKIAFEVLNPQATKEYFAEYAEDYNLGSLPHEKYYNLDAWAKAQSNKSIVNDEDEEFDFGKDEERLRGKRPTTSSTAATGPSMSKTQLQDLQRVERERVEADRMRKLGFATSRTLGVRYEDTMS